MPSVIIPACNEEAVIGRCLAALLDGADEGELEVIVICNGCKDQTAETARRFGRGVKVLETPVGSKIHALIMGDAAATRFPRFFIDADVIFPLAELRRVASRLENGILAAAPRAKFDLAGCSWAVCAFYDINDRLPSSMEGIGGSGVYALSREGRARIGGFPDLIADDGYVRIHFTPAERETLIDCRSIVFAPKSIKQLIHIKTRSHMGTAQLRQMVPALWPHKGPGNGRALLKLTARLWMWPKLAAYLFVKFSARMSARKKLRSGDRAWQRDASSRIAPELAAAS